MVQRIEAVLKKSKGYDYICLNANHNRRSIQLSCLGRHDKVILPLTVLTKRRIEERFGSKIDWPDIQNQIKRLMKNR